MNIHIITSDYANGNNYVMNIHILWVDDANGYIDVNIAVNSNNNVNIPTTEMFESWTMWTFT